MYIFFEGCVEWIWEVKELILCSSLWWCIGLGWGRAFFGEMCSLICLAFFLCLVFVSLAWLAECSFWVWAFVFPCLNMVGYSVCFWFESQSFDVRTWSFCTEKDFLLNYLTQWQMTSMIIIWVYCKLSVTKSIIIHPDKRTLMACTSCRQSFDSI